MTTCHTAKPPTLNFQDDASSSGSNPPASDTRLRMGLYYAVALIENVLLASLWSSSVRATLVHTAGQRRDAVVAVVAPFVAGIALMLVYYRWDPKFN